MKRSWRRKVLFLHLLVAGAVLLLAACQGSSSDDDSEPSSSITQAAQEETQPSPALQRLVFGGPDGQIYLINANGSDRQLISTPAEEVIIGETGQGRPFYTWPTWSPDGNMISYSLVIPQGDTLSLALLAKDLAKEETQEVYANPPGNALVGTGIPHYALWSPDSRRLAFLTATPQGSLDLLVGAPGEAGAARKVGSGFPFYYSWSPDSRTLLLHLGENLMRYEAETGGLPEPLNLPSSGGYRAPAWSPDGQRIAFLGATDTGQKLMVANADGSETRVLTQAPNRGAFLWSPKDDLIALANTQSPGRLYYAGLRLVDAQTGDVEQLNFDPVLAFFWSPDGEKLAFVRILDGGERLAWDVVELDSRRSRTLAEFVPSQDLISLFSFFDQYAYSNPPWSPDSNHLVFTGGLVQKDTPLPEQGQVYIVDVSGETPPQVIAQGNLAFFPAS